MKKVLWISRHEMTTEQVADLERIFGDCVTLIPWQSTVERVEELIPTVERCDVIAAVLPFGKLAELMKVAGEKPVLQSVNRRIATGRVITLHDGRTEPEFQFVHSRWEQILRLDYQVRAL